MIIVATQRWDDKQSQPTAIPWLYHKQKVDVRLLSLSCLEAKDTTQSLWETLVGLLKKRSCHKKHCGCMECAAV